MLKICVLGSGSKGNSIYIGDQETNFLIDAGLSGKETEKRLENVGVSLAEISAVLISHEHSDHTKGIPALSSRYNIPVFSNRLTAEKVKEQVKYSNQLESRIFLNSSPFQIGDFVVRSFSVFHDAMDPVGFIIEYKGIKIAVATDLGFATTLVKERLKGAHVVILESNYDIDLLRESKRPWSLKQRIMGRQGHLSNIVAGNLLSEILHDDLREIFLVHLSSDCNTAQVALETIQSKIEPKGFKGNIRLTYQEKVSDFVTISFEESAKQDSAKFKMSEIGKQMVEDLSRMEEAV